MRKVATRGAECVKERHWVHYFCDRLTAEEIHRLDNDPGYIYICKKCQVSDNTNLKAPVGKETASSKAPSPIVKEETRER